MIESKNDFIYKIKELVLKYMQELFVWAFDAL